MDKIPYHIIRNATESMFSNSTSPLVIQISIPLIGNSGSKLDETVFVPIEKPKNGNEKFQKPTSIQKSAHLNCGRRKQQLMNYFIYYKILFYLLVRMMNYLLIVK
jgi:hypothetical protein